MTPQMLKQVSEYKMQVKVIKEQEADMKTQVQAWTDASMDCLFSPGGKADVFRSSCLCSA